MKIGWAVYAPLWCFVVEVGIGLAGFVGWRLWLSLRWHGGFIDWWVRHPASVVARAVCTFCGRN